MSHRTATDVSSPPEYASTTRVISLLPVNIKSSGLIPRDEPAARGATLIARRDAGPLIAVDIGGVPARLTAARLAGISGVRSAGSSGLHHPRSLWTTAYYSPST